jgi:hypothetical protein
MGWSRMHRQGCFEVRDHAERSRCEWLAAPDFCFAARRHAQTSADDDTIASAAES